MMAFQIWGKPMSALGQKQTLPDIACGYRVAVTTNCGASAK
jgi:hypothetical protein